MSEAAAPGERRRYESYSHEELKAEVETGNEPGEAGEIGAGWAELGRQLHDSIDELVTLSGSSEQLWQGPAGEALRAVLDRAAHWSAETAVASAAVGDAVARQAEAAARARAQMPEPVGYDPAAMIRDAASSGSILALAGLSAALTARAAEAESARQRAVDVLYARDEALASALPDVSFSAPPPLTSGSP
ncbi:PE-PGRS family protein [Prauserella muralis]|uniref:PE-PGRS family protein n=1 Tax=Prauserella muralis TaxID=588067 RepID=A0A2V4BEH9_9PSEU|nr:PE-PGRS family protein [Prauserella muralis]PXY28029.1 PE-PGRS family protein [Prauserella muralis]TWE22176.1 hypothetical protein FHX69_3410 [Prauserella muralis]